MSTNKNDMLPGERVLAEQRVREHNERLANGGWANRSYTFTLPASGRA